MPPIMRGISGCCSCGDSPCAPGSYSIRVNVTTLAKDSAGNFIFPYPVLSGATVTATKDGSTDPGLVGISDSGGVVLFQVPSSGTGRWTISASYPTSYGSPCVRSTAIDVVSRCVTTGQSIGINLCCAKHVLLTKDYDTGEVIGTKTGISDSPLDSTNLVGSIPETHWGFGACFNEGTSVCFSETTFSAYAYSRAKWIAVGGCEGSPGPQQCNSASGRTYYYIPRKLFLTLSGSPSVLGPHSGESVEMNCVTEGNDSNFFYSPFYYTSAVLPVGGERKCYKSNGVTNRCGCGIGYMYNDGTHSRATGAKVNYPSLTYTMRVGKGNGIGAGEAQYHAAITFSNASMPSTTQCPSGEFIQHAFCIQYAECRGIDGNNCETRVDGYPEWQSTKVGDFRESDQSSAICSHGGVVNYSGTLWQHEERLICNAEPPDGNVTFMLSE